MGRSWWRRVDVLVAACLVLGDRRPGHHRHRHQHVEARKVECQDNLKLFTPVLHDYARQNGTELPLLNKNNPKYIRGRLCAAAQVGEGDARRPERALSGLRASSHGRGHSVLPRPGATDG